MIISFGLAFLTFLVALASEIVGMKHSRRMAEIYDLPQPQKRSFSSILFWPSIAFFTVLLVCELFDH